MLTSVRSLMAATIIASIGFTAAPALADSSLPITVSANASVVSQYRFRGVDLSGGDPVVQGGIDIGLPGGFYVGTWGSPLDVTTVGYGSTEIDAYGGWSGPLGKSGLTADVGIYGYLYPNSPPGDYDYVEIYGSLSYDIGPISTKAGIYYAPSQSSLNFDGTPGGDSNTYLYGELGYAIPSTPLSLSAHLGWTSGPLSFKSDSSGGYGTAFDWSLGGSVAIGEHLSLGASYIGAQSDPVAPGAFNFTKDAVVVSLGASF